METVEDIKQLVREKYAEIAAMGFEDEMEDSGCGDDCGCGSGGHGHKHEHGHHHHHEHSHSQVESIYEDDDMVDSGCGCGDDCGCGHGHEHGHSHEHGHHHEHKHEHGHAQIEVETLEMESSTGKHECACGGSGKCDGNCDGNCECGGDCACKKDKSEQAMASAKALSSEHEHVVHSHSHEAHHHAHDAGGCGCGSGGCGCHEETGYSVTSRHYRGVEGYIPEADLGLGCGVPTDFIDINEGDTVLDLGSGAGNDAFIASRLVGSTGNVIGVDLTIEMVNRAKQNKVKFGFNNIDFLFGDIENLPLDNEIVDVALSNCVLNLVPDKRKAFSEIHRVLKPGGAFCISDIVIDGQLPEKIKSIADFYTGCIAGACQMKEYIDIIETTGFTDMEIHNIMEIEIADDVLVNYLSREEIKNFIESGVGIYSLTISAKK